MSPQKVPVSKRALVQRINRKLAEDNGVLRAARGFQEQNELGELYVLSIRKNYVTEKHVDLEKLGRKLGVLRDHEILVEH
jgi:hypothetical protein